MKSEGTKTNGWEITGIIAALAIILSVPLYAYRAIYLDRPGESASPVSSAEFVGRDRCISCHRPEYEKWENSHHDLAMDVATPKTVLGDFNNAVYVHNDVETRFYMKDDKFFVHTEGPDGTPADFEVAYTFGVYPLQQYLVPFPGGRLQCLTIAWDVDKRQWYSLYPDQTFQPDDWMHWTRGSQNWNGMCAECHSTHLVKGYDMDTDTFNTTWSEIDVSCEACHGPASRHVAWAEMPDMARPEVENYALSVDTSDIDSRRLVELCAPCHSRRSALGDYTHVEADLLDSMLPSLLTEALYFPDGQILAEVYVYGSFTQSKMYHRDVRCSDCHDVHSTKVHLTGNDLCLQCHKAGEYDTREHHFHKKAGEAGDPIRSSDGTVLFDVGTGAQCVQCHMPGRYYMGIDYRPDHSLRIPRPDLSIEIHTPDACVRCHVDKTSQWADEAITGWYGPGRRSHYGTVLAAGRDLKPEARQSLIRLAGDTLYPVIVRATALSLLSGYPGEDTTRAMETALMDDEALIRRAAAENLQTASPEALALHLGPLLYDPVRAVRQEAARRLVGDPANHLDPDKKKVFQETLADYEASMAFSGDFAFGRFNLADLYAAQGKTDAAAENYLAALAIDGLFYPAKVNLAMLYNQTGRQDDAETLFREVVTENPDLYEIAYSLGLLLAERGKYEEAAVYLARAVRGLPTRARVHYNLGLLLQHLGREDAEAELRKALDLEPDNLDFLYALADHYLKHDNFTEARKVIARMIESHPENQMGHRLMRIVDQAPGSGQPADKN